MNLNDFQFEWTSELELFVVRQFAEFVNPFQIAKNIMDVYYDACESDLRVLVEAGNEEQAQQAFAQFLLRRIYQLSPRVEKFPKKYQELYNQWRDAYLNDLDASYLAHSRNRLRELDKLYSKAESAIATQIKPADVRGIVVACLEILKEARTESNKTELSASYNQGDVKISLHTYLASLPPERVMEIKEKISRGEPIELPDTVESGYSLNPVRDGSGRGASGEENGSTATVANPRTEE